MVRVSKLLPKHCYVQQLRYQSSRKNIADLHSMEIHGQILTTLNRGKVILYIQVSLNELDPMVKWKNHTKITASLLPPPFYLIQVADLPRALWPQARWDGNPASGILLHTQRQPIHSDSSRLLSTNYNISNSNSNSESIPFVEATWTTGNSPKKVEEAATAAQQALHEVEVEIPSEECQDQTGPDSLLFTSTAFKETGIMSGEKEFLSSAWAIKQLKRIRSNLS